MVDIGVGRFPGRSLGTGIGFVLLAVAAVTVLVLRTVGSQYVPEMADPVSPLTVFTVLLVVAVVYLVIRASRRLRGWFSERLVGWWPAEENSRAPLEPIPALEDELRGHLSDYATELDSYRAVLEDARAGDLDVEKGLSTLETIQNDLDQIRTVVENRRYISTYRRYYQARRELVSVVPYLAAADSRRNRQNNRLRELVDMLRTQASEVRDRDAVDEIRTLLNEVDTTQPVNNPAVVDTSPLKMASRRIDSHRLARLKYILQLRHALMKLNFLLGATVVFLAFLPLLLVVGTRVLVATFPGLDASAPLDVPVLFWHFPLVLFFGFLGAAVNITRRLGGGFGLFEAAEMLELPNDVILSKLMLARLLFGSLAGFVVYVFATTSTNSGADTFAVQFLFITSFFAGFSEQFFDNALAKARPDRAGTDHTRQLADDDEQGKRQPTAGAPRRTYRLRRG